MKTANPFARRRAIGSKWTALQPVNDEKHHEVVSMRGQGAELELELRCVLNGSLRIVALATLRDPDQWLPGWL